MEKTNVMRILDQKKIKYNEYFYGDTEAVSGVDVANVLNEDPNKVFKTLVTVCSVFGACFVFAKLEKFGLKLIIGFIILF